MPVDRTRLKQRAFDRQWARQGKDYCDVIVPSLAFTTDEYGSHVPQMDDFVDYGDADYGVGVGPIDLLATVPCIYEPLSQRERVIAGGETSTLTHRIVMKATATTLGIKSDYQIRVAARGDKPTMVFDNPLPKIGSFSPLVEVAASMRTL